MTQNSFPFWAKHQHVVVAQPDKRQAVLCWSGLTDIDHDDIKREKQGLYCLA